MSGTTDVVKGRIKEAAGVLIDNDKLREEGKTDQAVGKIEQVAEKAFDDAKKAATNIVDKAKEVAKQAVADVKESIKT